MSNVRTSFARVVRPRLKANKLFVRTLVTLTKHVKKSSSSSNIQIAALAPVEINSPFFPSVDRAASPGKLPEIAAFSLATNWKRIEHSNAPDNCRPRQHERSCESGEKTNDVATHSPTPRASHFKGKCFSTEDPEGRNQQLGKIESHDSMSADGRQVRACSTSPAVSSPLVCARSWACPSA
jgi:hypothetical protein